MHGVLDCTACVYPQFWAFQIRFLWMVVVSGTEGLPSTGEYRKRKKLRHIKHYM